MTKASKPAVLILGVEPRISVPVARSLHGHGVVVILAAISQQEQQVKSHAISRFVRLPEAGEPDFVQAFTKLVKEENIGVVFPATDAALAAIANYYDSLGRIVALGCPPPEVIDGVLDKEITLRIAASCGVPIPRQYEIDNDTSFDAVCREIHFPVIAKPGNKRLEGNFKVRHFDSAERLGAAFEAGDLQGTLLQEYCPGVGVGVEMLVHEGQCIAAFQHRRIKEVPHTGGAAVLAVAEPVTPSLGEMALRLLQALQWDGVAMVEFRHDRTTGRTALMEVNGRYWGTVALPIAAGVAFPVYQYQLAMGETPQVPGLYKTGLLWRWTAGYARRSRGLLADCIKRPARADLWSELFRTPLAFVWRKRDAMWSWSDPMPAISEFVHECKTLVGSDAGGVFRRVFNRGAASATTEHLSEEAAGVAGNDAEHDPAHSSSAP